MKAFHSSATDAEMLLSPTMNNADLESPSTSMTGKARSIGGEKPIKKKSVGDKNQSIKAKGKGGKSSSIKLPVDRSPPPRKPPSLPQKWEDNIPIFRHREYLVVQALFSFRPKFDFYNISGRKMGECVGKILSWGGEFDFYDVDGRHVAKLRGNPTLLNIQKTFEIFDHRNVFKGAIKSSFGFPKRTWEIYDAHKRLIGRPSERVWLKTNFEMVDSRGNVLLSVDKKLWAWRDQFRVVVTPRIDPLLALAFAIAVDYMYWQQND
ncbi:MAG: hypothetical protein GF308_00660 [Candidatus Heimdallarchaeota archaeon]|nr:hypothetical protein [Candidatus Heimdallarchaeota archaeon]